MLEGSRKVAGRELFATADVDHDGALVEQLADLAWIHLVDLALDLAEQLCAGGAHL